MTNIERIINNIRTKLKRNFVRKIAKNANDNYMIGYGYTHILDGKRTIKQSILSGPRVKSIEEAEELFKIYNDLLDEGLIEDTLSYGVRCVL